MNDVLTDLVDRLCDIANEELGTSGLERPLATRSVRIRFELLLSLYELKDLEAEKAREISLSDHDDFL